jgi:hypothetical protein
MSRLVLKGLSGLSCARPSKIALPCVSEQGHALQPGTLHTGDVGAPEHSPRPESVKHTAQRVVDAWERVWIPNITGSGRSASPPRSGVSPAPAIASGCDRRPLPLRSGRHGHVVDADSQSRVPIGDLSDLRQGGGGGNRDAHTLGHGP